MKLLNEEDMDNKILVSVSCTVFNHAPYLRQCLEGLVMQKTDFKYEVIVHDDASTDGSGDIVREYAQKYPDIIVPFIESENQYSQGKMLEVSRNVNRMMKGKYVAVCEGDDYWIDPNKLQMQVDYLEEHPECNLCHTSFKYYYEEEKKFYESNDIEKNRLNPITKLQDFYNGYWVQYVTIMYRKAVLDKIMEDNPFLFGGYFKMGDSQICFELLKSGPIHFIPKVTCVYRKNEGSATRGGAKSQYRFRLSTCELHWYYSLHCDFDEWFKEWKKKEMRAALVNYRAFDYDFVSQVPFEYELTTLEKFVLKTGILKTKIYLNYRLRRTFGKHLHKLRYKYLKVFGGASRKNG